MATKREEGHLKFYPYKKGKGSEKVLDKLKGGTTSFGVVFTQKLEVWAILKVGGATKSFHSFKGREVKSFTLS